MANLDFIVDDGFRASLGEDLAELDRALAQKNIKSSHLLAGSIVEAVLIDYLISEGAVTREAGLKLDLGKAIDLCKDKEIITERTASLSSVVRLYRNLIHPGRAVRTQEKITQQTADVAKAVVTIVVDEISAKKLAKYGRNAAQIVSKIEHDSGTDVILVHLLQEAQPREIEKLLMEVLPTKYTYWHALASFDPLPYPNLLQALSTCFRVAFTLASESTKKRVANQFAEMLRTISAN